MENVCILNIGDKCFLQFTVNFNSTPGTLLIEITAEQAAALFLLGVPECSE